MSDFKPLGTRTVELIDGIPQCRHFLDLEDPHAMVRDGDYWVCPIAQRDDGELRAALAGVFNRLDAQ